MTTRSGDRGRTGLAVTRAFRIAGACGAVVILLASCERRSGAPADAPAAPRQGGVLRVLSEPAVCLDPRAVDEVYESAVVRQVYEGLLAFDPSLRLIPGLARSWTISPDGTTYRFFLRPGIQFHDGTRLTAKDVVFSIQRCLDPDYDGVCLARSYLLQIRGAQAYQEKRAASIEGLRTLDETTIEIELESPLANFLKVMAMDQTTVLPRHAFHGSGADQAANRPIGTGPFRFASRQSNGGIALARFDGYWGSPAYLDSVLFIPLEGAVLGQEPKAIAKGEVAFGTLSSGLSAEARSLGLRVYRSPELSLAFVGFRCDRSPFHIAAVRRAALLAIQRDEIRAVDPEGIVPVFGLLPPGMPGRMPVDQMPRPDREEARRILAQAGFPGGKGLPPVTIGVARGGPASRKVDGQIRDDLASVGFDARLQVYTWRELDSLVVEGALQAFVMSWVADLPDPDAFLYPLIHSEGESNLFAYASAEADDLLDRGRHIGVEAERPPIYQRLQEVALRDAPLIPLYHSSIAYAWRPDFDGVEIGPTGFSLIRFDRVHRTEAASLADRGEGR